jgi:LAO/AO transport system ATPase
MMESLFGRFRSGDRRALARLLTQVAHGENLPRVTAWLAATPRSGRVVAVTGSPGVGKSSLIGKLIEHLRGRGETLAVLACDPQSPYSGGALLGDRFRMPSRPDDDGVFIRSLAAVSGHGAVADHLPLMIRLCLAFGFGTVLVETVGAGQGDTAVRAVADIVVLLVQPETGDDLQWEKAGIIETADILVVHKSDLPGAEQALAQARAAVELSGHAIPVLRISSKSGEGIDALVEAITASKSKRADHDAGRDLLQLAQEALAERFHAADAAARAALRRLTEELQTGKLPPEQAADAVLAILNKRSDDVTT